MMFLQYASLGLWAVTVGTYIDRNTGGAGEGIFGPGFIGLSATAGAIGALISPVLLGIVADRYFSTEKLLSILHVVCVGCLVVMATSKSSVTFYMALLAYFQAYSPTSTLTSSLALRHLPDSHATFSLVRSFGTVGWVASGLVIGLVCPWLYGRSIEATVDPIWIAAGCGLLTAAYCVTLPATPALGRANAGWHALTGGAKLWANRPFLIFIGVSVLATAPSQFYNSFVNPFLNHEGFEYAAAKLTLGQVTEVACLIGLASLRRRLGLKRLFLVGALAWAGRFLLFSLVAGGAGWLAYPAIFVHGACFAFVYMLGQLYADQLADRDARGAAQGVHSLATNGLGHLLGAFAGQWAQACYLTPEGVSPAPYDYGLFWLTPFAISLAAAFLFAGFFNASHDDEQSKA